jgi:hypothetical protein
MMLILSNKSLISISKFVLGTQLFALAILTVPLFADTISLVRVDESEIVSANKAQF